MFLLLWIVVTLQGQEAVDYTLSRDLPSTYEIGEKSFNCDEAIMQHELSYKQETSIFSFICPVGTVFDENLLLCINPCTGDAPRANAAP